MIEAKIYSSYSSGDFNVNMLLFSEYLYLYLFYLIASSVSLQFLDA